MLFALIFWLFSAAYAEEPNYELTVNGAKGIVIYIDIEKDNKVEMTNLIASRARLHKENINTRFSHFEGIGFEKRKIRIYDQNNIKYFNKNCDYKKKALDCGVQNGHWTISSSIFIEDLHAAFILNLYDETGNVISSASIPIYGWIEFLPQWKKTTIKDQSVFGEQKREVLEQWPDKQKKHPPHIRSRDVSQALLALYLSFDRQ
tara:strand:- start:2701 stop:3312 length:612 start_codon:yes stop_codon:yes gene_type:complete